jgi:hypothetical protein
MEVFEVVGDGAAQCGGWVFHWTYVDMQIYRDCGSV